MTGESNRGPGGALPEDRGESTDWVEGNGTLARETRARVGGNERITKVALAVAPDSNVCLPTRCRSRPEFEAKDNETQGET